MTNKNGNQDGFTCAISNLSTSNHHPADSKPVHGRLLSLGQFLDNMVRPYAVEGPKARAASCALVAVNMTKSLSDSAPGGGSVLDVGRLIGGGRGVEEV